MFPFHSVRMVLLASLVSHMSHTPRSGTIFPVLYGRNFTMVLRIVTSGFLAMIHPKCLSDSIVLGAPESGVHFTLVWYLAQVGETLTST